MIQNSLFVSFNWLLLSTYTNKAPFHAIITDKMIQKAQFVSNKGKL